MRRNIVATVGVAVALCALVVTLVLADGTAEPQEAVKLYRGTSIIAASDPSNTTYRPNFTPAACRMLMDERWKAEAASKTSGAKVTYKCQVEERAIITFHPAPVQVCGARPGADEQRQQACPSGTVGTWLQDRVWTLNSYPTCWTQGQWTPATPPAGMCAPVTTGSATLIWTPPTQNTDGSSLTNLAGYRIHYGASASALTQTVQVANPGASRYEMSNLTPGTVYFAVRAYTSAGTESALSKVTSKAIQ